MSGDDGDDAQPYQELRIRKLVAKLGEIERTR